MKKKLKWVGIIFAVLIIIVAVEGKDKNVYKKIEKNTHNITREAQQNETDNEHEWVNSHFADMMEAQQRFESEKESVKKKVPKTKVFNNRLYYLR